MNCYILIYYYVADYLEKRRPYRLEHIKLAKEEVAAGNLLLGGATKNPADQGILLFKVSKKEVIEQFVARDPYVKNGVVSSWEIKEWDIVVGSLL